MTNMEKRTADVMAAIDDLMTDARRAGNGDLMNAAGRAYQHLYDYQTVMLKDKIVAQTQKDPTP